MIAAEEFGREIRARYAFRSAAVELYRALPLVAGEPILLQGMARLRQPGRLPRPVLVRLTSRRLMLLIHRASGPDRVLEIPRAAVSGVSEGRGTVQLVWCRSRRLSEQLRLRAWSGALLTARPLRDAGELVHELQRWLVNP